MEKCQFNLTFACVYVQRDFFGILDDIFFTMNLQEIRGESVIQVFQPMYLITEFESFLWKGLDDTDIPFQLKWTLHCREEWYVNMLS